MKLPENVITEGAFTTPGDKNTIESYSINGQLDRFLADAEKTVLCHCDGTADAVFRCIANTQSYEDGTFNKLLYASNRTDNQKVRRHLYLRQYCANAGLAALHEKF